MIFHSVALEFELSVIPKGSKEKDSETGPRAIKQRKEDTQRCLYVSCHSSDLVTEVVLMGKKRKTWERAQQAMCLPQEHWVPNSEPGAHTEARHNSACL